MSRRGLLKGSRRKAAVTKDSEHDAFLNDATHEVGGLWVYHGGRRLTSDELYALNDLLTAFFGGIQ